MQADWRDGTLADRVLLPASSVTPVDDDLADIESPALAVASRFVVPFGGLQRGRLAAGETLIVNGATGAYGSTAVLLAVAMGAGRVVAAGRTAAKLEALCRLAGKAVVPVALTGSVAADAAALRDAAMGGANMAFDMVGGATDPSSTLAALHALRRRGRLVLMGSMLVDLPVPYLKLMLDSIEIIGNFMHEPAAYRNVLALVRAGRLDLRAIAPLVYSLADLPAAMAKAEIADSLEAVVVVP
jgi:alcohol dehydrogenase